MNRAAARSVLAATVAAIVAAVTFDAATATAVASEPSEQAWIVEERTTPEQTTVVVPRHVGAPPLAANAFRVVIDGTPYPATVTRPVDQGIDIVVLLDAGRLGGHLLPAKGAAAELLLQLPDSVRVLVWGASAVAPPADQVPVAPAEGVVALGAVQPAPAGDLGATLRALAGRLHPARRHAAVVVTPAGEHVTTLPQAADDYEAGIELVELSAADPAGGPEILAALDAYALELPGTYEVSMPAAGDAEALLVTLDDGVVRLDLPGAGTPPTTVQTATTIGTETPTTLAEVVPVTIAPVNTAPPVSPATLPPLSVELSTRVRPDESTDVLGITAIGIAVVLSALLATLLTIRLRRARRGAPDAADDGRYEPTTQTLAELYGLHPDGTTAPACRLLCTVELAAASRLDGVATGLAEIRAALDGHGDSDLRRWVDMLHSSLLLRSRRPLADQLRGALERLGVRSDLAAAAGRVASENDDPAELHRGLFEVGDPRRFGHRIAAFGLALRDAFETRPAPLAGTPFLSWGPQGPDDVPTAVVRATAWHETVKRRMLNRLLDRTVTARSGALEEDPAELVVGLLDKLVPVPAHRP